MVEYLIDKNKMKKNIKKVDLKKSSNKDIFIKKNNKEQNKNLNPKNIQFQIGPNIKIDINF